MSLFSVIEVAGSAMNAQSVRLNVTSSNLANAGSVSGDPDKVYRARQPIFSAFQQSLPIKAAFRAYAWTASSRVRRRSRCAISPNTGSGRKWQRLRFQRQYG